MIIPGKLANLANSTAWGILESPNTTNLLVGKALVDLQREAGPVRFLNLSEQFKRGLICPHARPVVSVISAPKGGSNGNLGSHKIKEPDSLQRLYKRK